MRPFPTFSTAPAGGLLAALLAIGLLVRLAGLAGTGELGIRIADEVHYHTLATSLVEGRGFAFEDGPTSLRPPLYPAFVASIWTLSGTRSLQAVRAAQIGLSLLTVIVVFLLGRDLFGERAGLAAAALACFYPSLLISNYLLLTEVLFALLVVASAWAVVRLFTGGSLLFAAAAGILLGLAALTRSVLYPFPLVLGLLVVAAMRGSFRRRTAVALAMTAAFAIVLAPWAIRNTRLQGVPVLVDTMGGLNLRMGNYEHTPHDRMWAAVAQKGTRSWIVGIPQEPPKGGAWTEGTKEQWARTLAVRFMLENPALTLWRSAIKFGDFWGLERDFIAGVQLGLYEPPGWLTTLLAVAITVSYPLVLFTALAGVSRLSRADWPHRWLPLLLVLFVCLLHTIVFGHPRYRLPLMPLLCVYAGFALASPQQALSARRGAVIAATLAAAFVSLWAVQFVWRDWSSVERLITMAGLR